MMTSEYRFSCRSCKYECVAGIGTERGPHFSKTAMVCRACKVVATYTVPNPGALMDPPVETSVCKNCHSSDYLEVWDGLTCPQCGSGMKALGSNTRVGRPFRYW